MAYQTIKVRLDGDICYIQLNRPHANNTINGVMIEECFDVFEVCKDSAKIVVIEGLPDVFCSGADLQEVQSEPVSGSKGPECLYDLWLQMVTGPYIVISVVRGKVNAGGIGFIAASDIVLADSTASFALSELLFGLFPALVMPFLIRRVGLQRANYMTMMTQPISTEQALGYGLVDAQSSNCETLLRKHLLRLRKLPKTGITNYKKYMNSLNQFLIESRDLAVDANREIFSDEENLERIRYFVQTGELMN